MVQRGLLDTNLLIAEEVSPLPGQLAIRVISRSDLNFGVLIAASPEVRALPVARLGRLQRGFDPLPVDDAVADKYGEIAAHVAAAIAAHTPAGSRAAPPPRADVA